VSSRTSDTGLEMDAAQETSSRGVRERRFNLDRAGRVIPGLVWTPEDAPAPLPLVLIGHGASGSKREPYVVAVARRFVRHHGFAAVAIDGPIHGDRRADGGASPDLAFLEFGQLWRDDPTMTDQMVEDWRAVLDAVRDLGDVGAGPLGWWGLSMGTIIGLPVVAAEPRIQAAVLGLMGIVGPTKKRIEADARGLGCPVLLLQQWDDELFARQSTLDLFDAIGSKEKQLHANPGRHTDVPPDEFEATTAFLARHLRP
jgi:dienelactone hydrolase